MPTSTDPILERLRSSIRSDMVSVQPLRPPWQRAQVALALGLILLLLVWLTAGLRQDATRLGPVGLWGFTLAQLAAGYGLFAAALTTVVPGAARPQSLLAAATAAGLLTHLALAGLTYSWSPVRPIPDLEWHLRAVCFSVTTALGLAPLAVGLLLANKGLLMRPALLGFLCGSASGLIAEAAWRTHCAYSSPGHVLTSHTGGILALSIAGSLLASAIDRRRAALRRVPSV